MHNEFKSVACDVIISGIYNISSNCVDSQEHIAHTVGALLDMKTGVWMNNGRDTRVSDAPSSYSQKYLTSPYRVL
jgi:hypothetical protein